MDRISFSIGCRNCRETDGERYVYEYDDAENQLPLAGRSEFGVMRVVELMNNDLGVTCPFCQSTHLDVFDVAVNDQMLFDYDQLCRRCNAHGMIVFSLTVDKVAGQLDAHVLANPSTVPTNFLAMALDHMVQLVNERPPYDFTSDANGRGYLCVAGCWAADEQNRLIIPQRYICRGLSREELLFVIQSVKNDITA